ncbi:solute carrier family 66 member 3 [Lethenteron reissneri]|uniref:solute carrier family 66 member 3 n=1 Tax=Lethenteron reissneri TaxID=7753 RepID=UPI002AB7AF6A|nr:solute carrier family 66 member 3 [Lethenteron reissneri]
MDLLLDAANFSTLLVSMVLKLPQMVVLVNSRSSRGLSLPSLLLELGGFVIFLAYQMYYGYPVPTYFEYPILVVQDLLLLLLILYYNGNLGLSIIFYATLCLVAIKVITLKDWIIDICMACCTMIGVSSKLAQLGSLWKSQDSGQLSAATWAMAVYTSAARIFTTFMTTQDFAVLLRFTLMLLLNFWVLCTIIRLHNKRKLE